MMALGFLWVVLPLTRHIYSDWEEKAAFLKRHVSSFNSNPYLANYAVGAVARLEQERMSAEKIVELKESLMGPLGALGDSLIWVRLRPALGILGIILALKYGVLGSIVFFLSYNIFQLYLRYLALRKGYSLGFGVVDHLTGKTYPRLVRLFGIAGAILFGFFFVFGMNDFTSFEKVGFLLFFLTVFLFSIWGIRKNLNPGLAFWMVLFGGIGVNFLLKLVVK